MSKQKDRNAQALNKKRNATLSPRRRSQIARHAAKTRWTVKRKIDVPMATDSGG